MHTSKRATGAHCAAHQLELCSQSSLPYLFLDGHLSPLLFFNVSCERLCVCAERKEEDEVILLWLILTCVCVNVCSISLLGTVEGRYRAGSLTSRGADLQKDHTDAVLVDSFRLLGLISLFSPATTSTIGKFLLNLLVDMGNGARIHFEKLKHALMCLCVCFSRCEPRDG